MKKILSLVLALMMVLTAVSALAVGSKETPGGGGSSAATDEEPEIKIVVVEGTELSKAVVEQFKKAFGTSDPLAPLSAEIKEKVPADYGTVNEMLTAQFSGEVGAVKKEVKMNMKFETAYGAGEKVIVVIGILPADATSVSVADIVWQEFDGTGEADGSVTFTIPKDTFVKINTNPFVIGVISQNKK